MDPVTVIRSKAYLSALVLAALLGAPISAVAYGFLVLVTKLQELAVHRPARRPVRRGRTRLVAGAVGGAGRPADRPGHPAPAGQRGPLARAGLRHGRCCRRATATCPVSCSPSLATLSLGAVLGPEAPLIAIGGGLAALTVRLVKKDAPPMARDDHGLGRQLRGDQHVVRLARCSARSSSWRPRASPARPSPSWPCPGSSPPGSVPSSSSDWTAGPVWARSPSPSPPCRPTWPPPSRLSCGRCRWGRPVP